MTEDESNEMPFTEHLAELRRGIAKCLVGVIVLSICSFVFAEQLFAFLTSPLIEAAAGNARLIGTGPAEAFIVKLKVSLFAGIALCSPLLFFELWSFIAPGLHSHEKRYAFPFVIISTLFFFTGATFCFKVVLPFAFQFFVEEFQSIQVAAEIRIGEYLAFTTKILLVFGLVFELPVLSFFLARLGILSAHWLLNKGRYSIVIIFIVAALLTPPDVVTQCLLAGPLIIIYGLCILVAFLANKKKPSKN